MDDFRRLSRRQDVRSLSGRSPRAGGARGPQMGWLALTMPMLVMISAVGAAMAQPCLGQGHPRSGSPSSAGAQGGLGAQPLPILLEADSRIWIEGTAGPIPYSCLAAKVDVEGAVLPEGSAGSAGNARAGARGANNPSPAGPSGNGGNGAPSGPRQAAVPAPAQGMDPGGVSLGVGIPVGAIDCGRRGINEDLREALKSDRHPEIRYALQGYRVTGERATGERTVETVGMLTVAGRTRSVTIPVTGIYDPVRGMRITGSHRLDMTDFGVTPPSPMMGLIKVDREMTIRFDVGFQASGWTPSNN